MLAAKKLPIHGVFVKMWRKPSNEFNLKPVNGFRLRIRYIKKENGAFLKLKIAKGINWWRIKMFLRINFDSRTN